MRRLLYIVLATIVLALTSAWVVAEGESNDAGYNCPITGEVLTCSACCPAK